MLRRLLKHLAAGRSGASPRTQPTHQAMIATAARLLKQADHAALVSHCKTYLAGHVDDPDALMFLASALAAQGDTMGGIDALQRLLAVGPETGEIRLALARLLIRDGRVEAALEAYRRALAYPVAAQASCVELAGLLNGLGRYDEAERHARTLPHSRTAQHELARALFEQGDLDESIGILRALVAAPDVQPGIHSDLLRALNYTDKASPEEVFHEHRQWDARHAQSLSLPRSDYAIVRSPQRRLRVGFVSPHFRKHAVTFFFESVLQHFDRAEVEIVLYSDAVRPDEYSARLRASAALWRDTVGLNDDEMAALVRRDAVDILIDLSGHTPGNRLLVFARRPAPVQMTWNGYPNTTGMDAMGYRITDAYCDPPGATEHLHSERLLRLPAVYMSWCPPRDAPAATSLPCLRTGRITFASFNACYKLSATTLRLWAEILARTPASRLLMIAVPTASAERRIRAEFERAGVAQDRLQVRGRIDHDAFLALHGEADIALDPYPYHGTTTTCFSLWLGVPVVSLCGRTHVSRVGATLLTHAGLPELVAGNGEDYVRIAGELAADTTKLARIRADLRASLLASPLADGAACARALQQTWRQVWAEWCAATH